MEIEKTFFKKLITAKIVFKRKVKASTLTSIGIGGEIDCVIFPTTLEKLKQTVIILRNYRYDFYKIGNGTNLIFPDKPQKKVAICMSRFKKIIEILGNRLLVDAGYNMSFVARKMCNAGYTGWEYAIGIPGFIGGAIKTNAGAFKNSTLKNLQYIWCIDRYGDLMEIKKENIKFSYRHTNIPERLIIYKAQFKITKGKQSRIEKTVERFKKYRKNMHPANCISAGSIFKNPPNNHAGKLIESCGLKGLKVGSLMVSKKHANFIMNTGGSKYSDFLKIVKKIQNKVNRKHNIKLKLEVQVLK